MFLPLTKEEMLKYGYEQPDFIYVIGDAYIDHPSFGPAIISRVLENFGYTCVIISQPDINNNNDFKTFGKPRLSFLVSSGNIDSMVNHYSVNKIKRKVDYYTPNGKMGKRPDRAVIRYCEKIREIYPDSDIIIGGIEASLRRLAHYDYWDNTVRKSILLDAGADLLLYGMGEKTIIEVADALAAGIRARDIVYVRNTVWKSKMLVDGICLPEFLVLNDKKKYVESFNIKYRNADPFTAKALIEQYEDCFVVQNPPEFPLTQAEMDAVYDLPYMRDVHPLIEQKGHVPAIDEVKNSIVINRGCFGSCNFCSLTFHQGRIIQSRSKNSVVNEATIISNDKNFKGYINDIGGPTANFYNPACKKQLEKGSCENRKCIGYVPCKNLDVSHTAYLDILRTIRNLPAVKKVFIRSGIRYDYVMYDKDREFFEELVKYHVSGQLKVAPEHIDDVVLQKMGKPSRELYDRFVREFKNINIKNNLEQYLVPYLMSSHPGSTLESAVNLACYLKKNNIYPEQVQDFYPTPSSASTCMYYTGIDPFTMEKVYVPKTMHEKKLQRALLQYYKKENYDLVYEALVKASRVDLIGFSSECLIRPRKL